jgi:hypothetical protein
MRGVMEEAEKLFVRSHTSNFILCARAPKASSVVFIAMLKLSTKRVKLAEIRLLLPFGPKTRSESL